MRNWLAAAAAVLLMSAGLMSAGPALAGGAQNASKPSPEQLAWFQQHTIFNSGLVGSHTIALTFDDGPNRNTPAVLDALAKYNVKGTFFIVGKMAKAYPDILRRIAAEGHLLANHSATHPLLGTSYDEHPERLVDQLKEVNDQIQPLMPKGTQMFFRAPYGSWRYAHAAILNSDPVLKNYIGPIYWNIGGETTFDSDGYIMSAADWSCWHKHLTAATCAKGYMREIRREDGGVVLMHCIAGQDGNLVAEVIPALLDEGYKFVRLDQVPYYNRYKTPQPGAPAVATALLGDDVVDKTEAEAP